MNENKQDIFNNQLLLAVEQGDFNIVKKLISQGISNKEDLNLPLIKASAFNCISILKYLIEHGADVNAQDNKPLILASRFGCLEAITHLVKNDADTQTHYDIIITNAIKNGHLDVIKYYITEKIYNPIIVLSFAKDYEKNEISNWCQSYINSQKLNDSLTNTLNKKPNTNKTNKI